MILGYWIIIIYFSIMIIFGMSWYIKYKINEVINPKKCKDYSPFDCVIVMFWPVLFFYIPYWIFTKVGTLIANIITKEILKRSKEIKE
jgi:O-antigen/teichoic acid export membrane protein